MASAGPAVGRDASTATALAELDELHGKVSLRLNPDSGELEGEHR
jgi:hypothetical protein